MARDSINRPQEDSSPEEKAGILGRTFFWWIIPILRNGNRNILVAEDLPSTDAKLASNVLRRRILLAWDQRVKPEGKITLPLVLLRCLKWPFIAAILPRLFLILFRYSQAILIEVTIRFVMKDGSGDDDTGYWLVIVAFVVYTGMALSTAFYRHRLNRLKVMIRGALIGLIHHRSLHVQSGSYDDADAVTLMSSDVDNLDSTGEMFHETWAQLLEVIVGTTLLAVQIGWLCIVPLFIIFLCSQTSRYVAKNLKTKQRDWNVATQKRIAMTSSMLASAKTMKMLGMAEAIKLKIQGLRDQEIEMSKKFRWMMLAYNASANALGIFSPVITLVLFAIISLVRGDGKLDTDTAFTSIALLGMVTHPANMVMTFVPRAIASLANFERIQRYLLESTQLDLRTDLRDAESETLIRVGDLENDSSPAIVLDDMSIRDDTVSETILRNINLTIDKASIVVCSGSVGSGKTTLARAILGEVPPSHGSISVSTRRIGYCAQLPWLPSGSIRDAICGSSANSGIDYQWYNTVTHACGLHTDLEHLPDKDETQIGSQGLNLSGGQRQRVALARAVYSRCSILVLDDPFSALDGKTEEHVAQRLLGPDGIFRKSGTTVFWITNAAQYFQMADHIIVLGESKIQVQGTWDQLKDTTTQILKAALREAEKGTGIPTQDISKIPTQKQFKVDAVRDLTRKTGDIALYGYYFEAVGVANLLFLITCIALYSVFFTFSQYWLKWWTEAPAGNSWFYIGGFIMLSVLAFTATNGIRWVDDIKIAPRSGAVLHQRLLETIIGVPLLYYSETNIGVILNRFGQDIQLVDRQLPDALMSLIVQIFKLTMQAAILFSVQKLMTITLPFCIVIVYFVQKIYLRTSRQLRFIELESRSAVYSSFLETVSGISTLRAFNWQHEITLDNIQQLDHSQKPLYLLFCLQRWLNLVLDLLIAGIATAVISLAVFLRSSTTGGEVGVALNMILVASTTLLKFVQNWTTLEISLGAVARLKEVVEGTEREEKLEGKLVAGEEWSGEGCVEFEDVTVAYNPTAIALRNISLKITAGQKVVICGRTGSGKSTLFLTLLGFLHPQTGTLKINSIPITHIPLQTLRQRFFITVPQDPFVLANASLRFNLDPEEVLPDEVVVAALGKTRLWKHFLRDANGLSGSGSAWEMGILDMAVSGLRPLSTGQAQLLSLARAILRVRAVAGGEDSPRSPRLNGNATATDHEERYRDSTVAAMKPILLLDEATSSLDPETDSIIQEVIQEEFTDKGYTVIVIAHRMSAVVKGMREGRDVVVWMGEGRVERVVEGGWGLEEEEVVVNREERRNEES